MQSISAFLDTTKVADFRWKHAEIRRAQVVCHMIYLFFGSSLGVTLPSFFIDPFLYYVSFILMFSTC